MANEEIKRIVMGLRPIDDDFMNIIFSENTPLVEYVLQVILDKSDLVIEESKTQVKTNHFGSRNVTFDVLAKDNTGKRYNIVLPRLTLIRYQAVKHLRSFLIHMLFSLPKKTF